MPLSGPLPDASTNCSKGPPILHIMQCEVTLKPIMPNELSQPKRRLSAVLLADVVGYSRLMSTDEAGTHAKIAGYVREVIEPTVQRFRGQFVRSMGDGTLVELYRVGRAPLLAPAKRARLGIAVSQVG